MEQMIVMFVYAIESGRITIDVTPRFLRPEIQKRLDEGKKVV